MKIKEFAENNPFVVGEMGDGTDVARVYIKGDMIALSVYPGNNLPYVVKINGKNYQSLKTVEEAGDYFDKVWKKLADKCNFTSGEI